jgi:hypothetical protein
VVLDDGAGEAFGDGDRHADVGGEHLAFLTIDALGGDGFGADCDAGGVEQLGGHGQAITERSGGLSDADRPERGRVAGALNWGVEREAARLLGGELDAGGHLGERRFGELAGAVDGRLGGGGNDEAGRLIDRQGLSVGAVRAHRRAPGDQPGGAGVVVDDGDGGGGVDGVEAGHGVVSDEDVETTVLSLQPRISW